MLRDLLSDFRAFAARDGAARCPRCNGTGQMAVEVYDHVDERTSYNWETCDRCDGERVPFAGYTFILRVDPRMPRDAVELRDGEGRVVARYRQREP